MRFRIKFERSTKQRMLPMDYQYYISAWIYKVLKLADNDFACFLHEKGYGANNGNKLYKLFCFSRLDFGKPRLWKERDLFEISGDHLSLKVSFDAPDAATTFIKGLFLSQGFYLGNRFNGLDLKVTSVEALPEPEFTETMYYRLQSPWVVSKKTENRDKPQYLQPNDPGFDALCVKHIVEKYKNTRNVADVTGIGFRKSEGFKRSGFVIKPGTRAETRVIGNIFDFTLTAPIDIHKMIWNAGVSEKSSSGFGWGEVVDKNR